MNYKKNRVLIAIFFFGFLISFISGYTFHHYYEKYEKYQKIKQKKISSNCVIEKIDQLPEDSILVIGHAYPRQEIIKNFIKENKKKINQVIFSGDYFGKPSRKKYLNTIEWFKKNNIKFVLVPGNHEVNFGDNANRDIFNEFFNQKKLVKISHNVEGLNIFFEDSNNRGWAINNDLFANIKDEKYKKNILIRHHIPVAEFYYYANSGAGLQDALPKLNEINDKVNHNLTIISGDYGNKSAEPVICYKFDKTKFILSGLTSYKFNNEFKEDNFLVISGNKINYFQLINQK